MASPNKNSSNNTIARTSTGVLDYLQSSLPRKSLQELYMEETRGRFVCRAVLQQLSDVAQQVVMRLHCTGGTFPAAGVKVWTSLSSKQHEGMLKELRKWAILQEADTISSKNDAVSLTIPFAKGLSASLCSLDTAPWTPLEPIQIEALEKEAGVPSKHISPEDLERKTQEQWDAVLHFLVGTEDHKDKPPPAIIHFLVQTGLMQPDPEYRGQDATQAPKVITEAGYDFMLQDNHQQVWHFVVQYLKSLDAQENAAELRREALLLLISLSFGKVGGAYLASSLNKNSRTMVKHLAKFGLLYTRKIGKATLFYPTRVAMQLVGTPNDGTAASSTVWSLSNKALEAALSDPRPATSPHLAIIVQTNFQLCAYTTSELHVSMLSLFCDVDTRRRLPNVVFMHITRDSVKAAFNFGIQARQILRFLEKHSHPKLRTPQNTSPIPGNVVDQIWLWDRELSRVRFTKVYQHECMMGVDEFRAVQQHASKLGALAYSSERRQQLLLDHRFVEPMQAFVQQWRVSQSRGEK